MTEVTDSSREMRARIRSHHAEILAVMQCYGATNLRIFGSVALGEAQAGSDLDLLVDLEPDGRNLLLRVSGLGEEVSDLLGVKVDVVTPELLRGAVSSTAHHDAVAV